MKVLYISFGIEIFKFAIAYVLYKFYKNPRYDQMYQKRWVLVIIFLTLFSAVFKSAQYSYEIYSKSHEWQNNLAKERILIKKEEKLILDNNIKITIPAGYSYSKDLEGDYLLLAHKVIDKNLYSFLIFLKKGSMYDLDHVFKESMKEMSKKYETFKYEKPEEIKIGGNKSIRTDISYYEEAMPMKGQMVFSKYEGEVYMLLLSTSKFSYDKESKVFDKIENSILFGPQR